MALLNGRWYERLVIVPFIANQTSASMIFPGKKKTEKVTVLKIPMGSFNQVRPVLKYQYLLMEGTSRHLWHPRKIKVYNLNKNAKF